jgi:hypothetical protein
MVADAGEGVETWKVAANTGCGISQLTFHADNECKNEAKAQIVTC